MSELAQSVQTRAGSIMVREASADTIERLGKLFPRVTTMENPDTGQRLTALMPVHDGQVLQGFRTGYGWHPPEERAGLEKAMATIRLRIILAAKAFLDRAFTGVLMPAACLQGKPGEGMQLGELLFLRSQGPLERGLETKPIATFEELFGAGATDTLMSYVLDVSAAWKSMGGESMPITDLEPCPSDWDGVQWQADIVLVGSTIFLIRPELDVTDPFLAALVLAGITDIEHTPSVLFIQPPPA